MLHVASKERSAARERHMELRLEMETKDEVIASLRQEIDAKDGGSKRIQVLRTEELAKRQKVAE